MAKAAKIFGILLLLSFVLGEAMMLCQATQPPPNRSTTGTPQVQSLPGFPLQVTRDDGRSLALRHPPQRIVSLSPGHTEVLYAIGAAATLVGADEYSDFPAAARALPKVGYSNVNLEALLALQPDLVIAVSRQRAAVPEMDKLGLPVLFLSETGSVDGILERVRLLGRVTGRDAPAAALAQQLQARMRAVQQRLQDVSQGPSVFYELGPELFTAGNDSFLGDLLAKLKLRNIAEGIAQPFPQLSPEQVIAQDPQVILLGDVEAGVTPELVRARPGWDGLAAVRNNRVLIVPDRDVVHRPGPRVMDGLEQLARLVYSERFS